MHVMLSHRLLVHHGLPAQLIQALQVAAAAMVALAFGWEHEVGAVSPHAA
jgi:hypothetical protein